MAKDTRQMKNAVPKSRIRAMNGAPVNANGRYVLYWMTACRRVHWNFGLDRAAKWALELKKPLLILEALRIGYPWASDRFHQFIIAGMADNAVALRHQNVFYYPYLEPVKDADKGLLESLVKDACVVVTDDFPAFFLPRMTLSVAKKIPVILELVDGNGLLPMGVADRIFTTAYSFRRFLQKNILPCLSEFPNPFVFDDASLKKPLPPAREVLEKWPPAPLGDLNVGNRILKRISIDHSVPPVPGEGGAVQGVKILEKFLKSGLPRYLDDRNQPDQAVTSGLSPYLHFGHISAHAVFHAIAQKENWRPEKSAEKKTDGRREGWWGMDPNAEAFLDQLISWRELGFNMCRHAADYDRYDTLPEWARHTLEVHAKDERPAVYSMKEFENAATHDPLWNAAQNQLVREGRIHNYLRMLWGKKILHWTASAAEALEIMIQLNNKYALDGRDPNSYSGVFWVLGRYDRAWGPERPVFGKVRYMSSKNTSRKIRTADYVKQYASNHTDAT